LFARLPIFVHYETTAAAPTSAERATMYRRRLAALVASESDRVRHGTFDAYRYGRCRCDECRTEGQHRYRLQYQRRIGAA
jgi:hypothetical protein